MELAADRDKLEFEREHPINVEPLRPDVIVIKKPPGAVLRQKIAEIFRGRNIIEFKSPEDSLSVSDYMIAFSYPCVYQREVNVSHRDITLTLVHDGYPRELTQYLKTEVKREVEEKSPGVFIVKGEMFPVQVIVGKRLPENENIWIKNLNRGKLDIDTLQKMSALKRAADKRINMEAYFSVLFAAKESLLEEVKLMGRTSLAEVIEEMGLDQEWEKRGFEKGIVKGIDSTLYVIRMLKDNVSADKIAAELNLPIDNVNRIKAYL